MQVSIDGVVVQVAGPTSILAAAKLAGIEIPHYCYHPGLTVVGQCRMCQVEVEKMPKLATACNTPVADGMVIHTNSPRVEKARRAVLEFYLLNHPLDCPICDKGGECPLQDYTLKYGPGESRSGEEKVHRTKHRVLGPHIVFDAERCIMCTRCVRFCQEVPKTGELGVFARGDRSEINVFPGRSLDNNYSGNVIDLCPVGALTSREYRFQARPWDLVRRTESVCPRCSTGCNVILDVRHRQSGEDLLRIRPRENQAVNRWWMCDVGRFGHGDLRDPRRIRVPWWRADDAPVELAHEELVERLGAALRRTIAAHGPESVGCVVSSMHTNEDLYLVRRLFREIVGTPHLDHRVRDVQRLASDVSEDGILLRSDRTANGRGARDLDVLPGPGGLDVAGMLEAAEGGRLRALFVFQEDLAAEWPGPTARHALRRLDLLVVSSLLPNETTALAHAVLPALSFAEQTGSFTNYQGRVQKLSRALAPPGFARPLSRFLADLALRLGVELGSVEPEAVWGAIGARPGPYQGIGSAEWSAIGPLGALPGELRKA
jgi:NADH-quinone oxidoreductase subunit G